MQDLPSTLNIETAERDDGSTVRVSVAGEIDAHSAPSLESALATERTAVADRLEVDLGGVTFMDSSGLRVMIGTSTRRSQNDQEFVLTNVPKTVRRLLDVSGVVDHLTIESDGA